MRSLLNHYRNIINGGNVSTLQSSRGIMIRGLTGSVLYKFSFML